MASIHKQVQINARPEEVWDTIRDVGNVHTRLAPGFVVDTRLEGDSRVVTFANGLVVRELIVDIDDQTRRMAYSAAGLGLTHHHASMQVFADGAHGSRLVWIADLLPNEIAGDIRGMMEQGSRVIQQTLERGAAAASASSPT